MAGLSCLELRLLPYSIAKENALVCKLGMASGHARANVAAAGEWVHVSPRVTLHCPLPAFHRYGPPRSQQMPGALREFL